MPAYAIGFSARKRGILERFLQKGVRSYRANANLKEGDTIYIWGSSEAPADIPCGVRVFRVEDGFLRSVGLGAGFAAPLSWVFDELGIYYDPSRPSSLESILQHSRFSPSLLDRASEIRRKIIAHGLSKYNVGHGGWERTSDDRTILVPGQVEDDASIKAGARHVRTNLDLLRAVRDANPLAHIVFKPHPDVVHGLRKPGSEIIDEYAGGPDAKSIYDYADEVVMHANIAEMLVQVDEVHCMTSLAGFEALLRNKPVTCYGQPFYSGWGLTTDIHPNPRRTRKLSLDQLVAGALIEYPSYIDPETGMPASVEAVVSALIAKKSSGPGIIDRLRLATARWVAA